MKINSFKRKIGQHFINGLHLQSVTILIKHSETVGAGYQYFFHTGFK